MSRMDVPKTNVMITLWVGFLFCKMSICKAGLYVWWGLPPIWWEFTFCNSYHRIWEHPCPCPLSTPNTSWKITPPCPSSLPPTRKKREAPSLHDATSHWLHAIFFPKLSYHYFWPGLLALPKNILPIMLGNSLAIGHCTPYPGFFLGGNQNLPNFDLKNTILTYTKDFPWEKWPKFWRIFKKRVSKSPEFYDK